LEVTTMNKMMSSTKAMLVVSFLSTVSMALSAWASPAPKAEMARPADTSAMILPQVQRSSELGRVVLDKPAPKPLASWTAPKKTQKKPCKEQNEGTRALIQGSGTVRTWTFCG
jgi:hypothetical protein